MPRPFCFQGEGAGGRRRAGGVNVVQDQNLGGRRDPGRYAERIADVFLPVRKAGACLGACLPAPPEDPWGVGPTGAARQCASDEGGEVEAPQEIFTGMDRNGDDRRPEIVREEVGPFVAHGLVQAIRQSVFGNRLSRVFRGAYPLPDASLVGEQGARGGKRGRWRAGGTSLGSFGKGDDPGEGTAPGTFPPAVCGPGADGRGGKVDRRTGEKRRQVAELGKERRERSPRKPIPGPGPDFSAWRPG
jgi:hypothetical protein